MVQVFDIQCVLPDTLGFITPSVATPVRCEVTIGMEIFEDSIFRAMDELSQT